MQYDLALGSLLAISFLYSPLRHTGLLAVPPICYCYCVGFALTLPSLWNALPPDISMPPSFT